MIQFHGTSMPEGAALSWSFSDIVIRRKGRLAFRYRVPGCSLLDQWPEAAHLARSDASQRRSARHPHGWFAVRILNGAYRQVQRSSGRPRRGWLKPTLNVRSLRPTAAAAHAPNASFEATRLKRRIG